MKALIMLMLWTLQGCPTAGAEKPDAAVVATCPGGYPGSPIKVEGDSYALSGDTVIIMRGNTKTILLGGPCKVEVRHEP